MEELLPLLLAALVGLLVLWALWVRRVFGDQGRWSVFLVAAVPPPVLTTLLLVVLLGGGSGQLPGFDGGFTILLALMGGGVVAIVSAVCAAIVAFGRGRH